MKLAFQGIFRLTVRRTATGIQHLLRIYSVRHGKSGFARTQGLRNVSGSFFLMVALDKNHGSLAAGLSRRTGACPLTPSLSNKWEYPPVVPH